jgi:hypothetical protein
MRAGRSNMDFCHDAGAYRTTDPANPETAVAYHQDGIETLYRRAGLAISRPIYLGAWCGRQGTVDWQDIIVAAKEGPAGCVDWQEIFPAGAPHGGRPSRWRRLGGEAARLAGRSWSALRQGGLGQWVSEARAYVRWHRDKRQSRG